VTAEDFDFELPPGQIAQVPPPVRGASRLMTVDRTSGAVGHRQFAELPSLLQPGDLLVVNETRVVPARLRGRKAATGGQAELLLVRPDSGTSAAAALEAPAEGSAWVCLGQASKGLKAGAELSFDGGLSAVVREARGGGEYRVTLHAPAGATLRALLERAGQVPLPPYIERQPTADDAARYQTVYARVPGSVAAPTAGLHFTDPVLAELEARGIERAPLVLDVGPGTFLPVREGHLEDHVMHSERFEIPEAAARQVNTARRDGRRIVAVGTTSVRALEAAWEPSTATLRSGPGETALFIHPGYVFRVVDALLTNFHLPRSTLLMLVSAFAGRERVLAAYREAVSRGYRFFSYGDAMLIGSVP
jgi:S-adenosylmethionine:tRNA ribosyltransferase-isomerase